MLLSCYAITSRTGSYCIRFYVVLQAKTRAKIRLQYRTITVAVTELPHYCPIPGHVNPHPMVTGTEQRAPEGCTPIEFFSNFRGEFEALSAARATAGCIAAGGTSCRAKVVTRRQRTGGGTRVMNGGTRSRGSSTNTNSNHSFYFYLIYQPPGNPDGLRA